MLRRRRNVSALEALVVGTALLASVVAARRRRVSGAEERVFRTFNDRSDHLAWPVWIVMQAGSLTAVSALAAQAARRGQRGRAATAAAYGTAVWAGIKLVKPYVRRGRPAEYLDGVVVRGEPQRGLGYPSGHAAVAMTVGLMAPCALGRPAHPIDVLGAVGVAALTGAARMYVGAHLPLDVVGGLAIGTATGRLGSRLLSSIGDEVHAGFGA